MSEEEKDRNERDREQEESSKFKISDRRKFTTEGELRQEREEEASRTETPEEKQEATPRQGEQQKSQEKTQEQSTGEKSQAEEVDFSSFLVSLATSGMVHLGEIPEPTTGQREENLEAARQMIEILSVLKEKTKGNLTAEENHLLENLLYELRMKFLAKSKVIGL